ncbi:MAG: hypothetical protein QNJ30_20550 [Kiloniellales bacterium]|nr:hypothetical protein [Kiloniellales bacterium]
MTACEPSWIELNAYVDGELDAGRAEAVARAAAADPEVASQIAALQRLKAVADRAVEQTLPSVPPPPRRGVGRGLGIATCLALLVLGAGIFLSDRIAGPEGSARVARAWAGHEAWLAGAGESGARAEPGVVFAALAALGAGAQVPQLDSARLHLDHVAVLPGGETGGALLHLGYRGTRGCRLSLFVFAADAGWPQDLALPGGRSRLGVGWRVADLGYLLLAEGMDRRRFDLIAEKVGEATRRGTAFDEATRSALRRSREASPPCQA